LTAQTSFFAQYFPFDSGDGSRSGARGREGDRLADDDAPVATAVVGGGAEPADDSSMTPQRNNNTAAVADEQTASVLSLLIGRRET